MRILTENKENVICCNTCDCLYEYESTDLKLMLNGCLIECPKCGQHQILVTKNLKPADIVVEVESC